MTRFRSALAVVLLAPVLIGGIWGCATVFAARSKPIVVGLLHSQTGPMAISERSMVDGEVLALEEIKNRGGLLGRPIEWVIADGKSDWPTFQREAERLIKENKVDVIIGCWTSASRKMVKPVVEQNKHLLIYPMAFEGLERSPNIIYTGAAPNQQIIPTVKWAYDTLNAHRFFLVGSDYVWPHSVNAIIKDQLKAIGAELLGEEYIFFGSADVDEAVAAIVKTKPDVILSSVVGDSNLAFYNKLRAAGITPDKIPVMSFSIGEEELRTLSAKDLAGNYATWDYFQSIDRKENLEFVRKFKERYGQERVTSDVIEASYNSVWLWAQAVEEANSSEVRNVLETIRYQSLNAPEGVISVDRATHHTWRPVYIAKIRPDGQFEIVWSSKQPARPVPFPWSRSRPQWEAFLDDLYNQWGHSWANPVPPQKKPGSA